MIDYSRFYFDKKLNDLNEEIEGKLAVIEGYSEIENSMRSVLLKQTVVETALSGDPRIQERIASLNRIIPSGVILDALAIQGNEADITGSAGSEALFAQTIANFKRSSEVSRVNLGQTSYDQAEGKVSFNIKVTYK